MCVKGFFIVNYKMNLTYINFRINIVNSQHFFSLLLFCLKCQIV